MRVPWLAALLLLSGCADVTQHDLPQVTLINESGGKVYVELTSHAPEDTLFAAAHLEHNGTELAFLAPFGFHYMQLRWEDDAGLHRATQELDVTYKTGPIQVIIGPDGARWEY